MRSVRCLTYNAVENIKFVANKIVYYYGTPSYFFRFLTFFEILKTVFASIIEAGFGKNCAPFMQPLFSDWSFYPDVSCSVTQKYPLYSLQQSLSLFVSELLELQIANYFLEIYFHTFGYIFRLLDERRNFVRLEFDNFDGGDNSMRIFFDVCSWEIRLGIDGWTVKEEAGLCSFINMSMNSGIHFDVWTQTNHVS